MPTLVSPVMLVKCLFRKPALDKGGRLSRLMAAIVLGTAMFTWAFQAFADDSIPLEQEGATPLEPEDASPEDLDPGGPDASDAVVPLEPEALEPEDQEIEAAAPDATAPTFLRPRDACPQGLELLVDKLLQDLPSYTHLVAGRSLGLPADPSSPFGTVIIASEPDYEPIDLAKNPYGDTPPSNIQQVFFTTLERQYWQNQPVSLQHYHWLFLTQGDDGWRLALMYSSLGDYPSDRGGAPSPPQESSDGIIGQAVNLWLRDCRAGAV